MKKDKSTLRKYGLRALVLTIGLLLLLMAAAHILLQSRLPGQWLRNALSARLHTQVSLTSLEIQWKGHTQITGLAIHDPDSHDPLLSVPALSLSHHSLLRILLTGSFGLKSVEVAKPRLILRQDASGAWNLQKMASGVSASPSGSATASAIRLPQISVQEADIEITDTAGTQVTFDRSHFTGHGQDDGLWMFTGRLGSDLEVTGSIALDASLAHSVDVDYTDTQGLLASLLKRSPEPVSIQGHWTGRFTPEGLSGRLEVDRARWNTLSVQGQLNLTAGPQSVVAHIEDTTWRMDNDANEPIYIRDGIVQWHRPADTLSLDEVSLSACGGTLIARGTFPLRAPLQTTGTLALADLDLGRVARILPMLSACQGRASGILKAGAAHARAPEPLALHLDVTLRDGRYKQAQIQGANVTAFLGPTRWILDQSRIDLLDGTMRFWVRATRHEEGILTYMHCDFNDIDVKQTLHAFDVNTQEAVGKASGTGMLVIRPATGMTGEMDIQLSQADLLNTVIIGTLYRALNLSFIGGGRPEGRGTARLIFEGNTLRITDVEYFNRGLEVRGAGSIQDVTQGAASPVDGYVMGSTRPLKGSKLPGLADLDRLLSSLQNNVATATVSQTLGDPKVAIVPFAQLQTALKRLLWTQLGGSKKSR